MSQDNYLRHDMHTQEGKELVSIKVLRMVDEDPDLSWLTEYQGGIAGETYKGRKGKVHTITKAQEKKWRQQDQERLSSYGQSWEMLGIRAEAKIYVDGVRQKITSGGLWGVESDSEEKYIQEVEKEEIAELKEIHDHELSSDRGETK